MAQSRELKVVISGDAKSLTDALSKTSTSVDKANGHFDKLHSGVKRTAIAFGGLAVIAKVTGLLEDSVKAAAKDEVAMQRASTAVTNSGESWKKLQKPIDDYLTKASETSGINKGELAASFAKAETATGNHAKAMKLLHLAMEISVQTGKPLSVVLLAVTKESQGNTKALAKYGVVGVEVGKHVDALKAKYATLAQEQKGKLTPAQKEAEKGALDHAKALDKAQNAAATAASANTKYAHALQDHAQTMAGKMQIFEAKFEEIKVRIGNVILPYIIQGLTLLMTAFDDVSGFIDKNKTLVEVLGVAVGVVTGILVIHAVAVKAVEAAQKIWTVVTNAQTGAQWLLNAAMNANPIGLVVIAVTGLIAGLVLLYTQSGTARDIINTAFRDIKRVGKEAFGFITDTLIPDLNKAWDTIKPVVDVLVNYFTGPFKTAFDAAKGVINTVTALLNGDFDKAWKDIKSTISGVFTNIDNALSGLPGKLLGYAKQLPDDAKKVGLAIVNGIIDGLGGLLDALINKVKDAVGSALDSATLGLTGDGSGNGTTAKSKGHYKGGVTKLASGGIVTKPTFALIGEAGPEAVIPLSGVGGGGSVNVTQNFHGMGSLDPQGMQSAAAWKLRMASR